MEKIKLPGKEFIRKILAGERDFSGIELEREYNLSEDEQKHEELYRYLRKQDFKNSPLIFKDSWFQNINFSPIPYSRRYGSSPQSPGLRFPHADCEGAYFVGCDFTSADLSYGNFREGSFNNSNLQYVDFNFSGFDDTDFHNARLVWTDLREAKNLERTRNMERAYFFNVKVTQKEKIILEKILKK